MYVILPEQGAVSRAGGQDTAGRQRDECAVPGAQSGDAEEQENKHPCARVHVHVCSERAGASVQLERRRKGELPCLAVGAATGEGLGTLSLALRGHGALDPTRPLLPLRRSSVLR